MDTPSEKKTQPSQNENQSLSSALNQIDPRSFIKPNKVRNPNKLTRTDYCHYYMPKKKRFCQVRPKPGAKYCPNHMAVCHGQIRVPCPHDPRHSVYQNRLKKHLKKCISIKSEPYIQIDINAGSCSESEESESESDSSSNSDPETDSISDSHHQSIEINSHVFGRANQLDSADRDTLLDDIPLPQPLSSKAKTKTKLSLLSHQQLFELIEKIRIAYQKYVPPIETQICYFDLQNLSQNVSDNITEAVKHGLQHSSLIGHMQRFRLLTKGNLFVEFGSGKGTLSHLLQLTLQSDHILIDRANFRRKKDMYHKGDNQKSLFKRIKADIKDLDFFHIPEVENRCGGDIVAFSKHLCGAATDLTLRCLLRENYNSKQNVESKVQHKVAAILIALCCHHRCKWRSYVNKSFMKEIGFSKTEFEYVCLMTSWAISDTKSSHNTNKSSSIDYTGLTRQEKTELGFQAKRLLDMGRVLFLRACNFESSLVYYIDRSISPENVLLIALPPKK